ncbi:hypothetical protein TrVFT333_002361 [Trichoderma virens FT-333]|nr:hypothetical protein TrVFT333_002361 [Trichoderma virens FT-333]
MFELSTLSADDWEAWRAVRLAALANAPDAFGSTFNDWVDASEDRWPRSRNGNWGPDGARGAEIISMWVDPGFRGRGLASSLIGKIASWAVRSGFSELRLAVRPDNAAARLVYLRNSFIVSDEPGDEIPDGRREIIMFRNLKNNPASDSPTTPVDP